MVFLTTVTGNSLKTFCKRLLFIGALHAQVLKFWKVFWTVHSVVYDVSYQWNGL